MHLSALTPAIRWLRTSQPGHVALLASHERVVVAGRVPTADEVRSLLSKAATD